MPHSPLRSGCGFLIVFVYSYHYAYVVVQRMRIFESIGKPNCNTMRVKSIANLVSPPPCTQRAERSTTRRAERPITRSNTTRLVQRPITRSNTTRRVERPITRCKATRRAKQPTIERVGRYQGGHPEAKNHINEWIQQHLPKHGLLVALDAEECNTGVHCLRAGFPLERLRLVQSDPAVAAQMRAHPLCGKAVVEADLKTYLPTLPVRSVGLLYADFCGQISQLTSLLSSIDVWETFAQGMVFVYTIQMRCPYHTHYTHESIVHSVQQMNNLAWPHSRWCYWLELGGKVYGGMTTQMCEIRHR